MIASQNDGTVPCGIDTSNRDRYQRLEVPNRAGGCPRHDFYMSDDLDAEARGDAGTSARRRLWGMCPRTAAFFKGRCCIGILLLVRRWGISRDLQRYPIPLDIFQRRQRRKSAYREMVKNGAKSTSIIQASHLSLSGRISYLPTQQI